MPLADLKEFKEDGQNRHIELLLPNLSQDAGVDILRKTGTQGDEKFMRLAVNEVHGHALTLILLGNYLRSQFDGDIRCRDRLGPLIEEPDQGGHARRVMKSYEKLLVGKPELSLLYILGLFDRPARKEAIDSVIDPSRVKLKGSARQLWNALCGFPETTFTKTLCSWVIIVVRNILARLLRHSSFGDLTAPLHNSSNPDFEDALRALRERGLVSPLDPQVPDTIDCHPLVRQHFGEAFKKHNPKGWKEAQSRLFEYFSSKPRDEQPVTLVEMEPLYAAVEHGCRAGRYTEAGLIYHHRMLRGAVYSCNHLGALQTDLALLTYFFDRTWSRPATGLSGHEKALLLHWSGTLLFTVGRCKEALQPCEEAIRLAIASKSWGMAATGSYYLSVAHMTLGDLNGAKKMAAQSIDYAIVTRDPYWLIGTYAALGHCLHQIGLLQEAQQAFQLSEKAMCQITPEVRLLHSIWSYWYCELLIDIGNFQDAKTRGEHALRYAPEQPKSSQGELLDKTVAELTIARALLQIERQKGASNFRESQEYFGKAFESLRLVNHQWLMPEALFARSEYYQFIGKYAEATADLNDVQSLASRDGLKLHTADWRLGSAQLCLDKKDAVQARDHLDTLEKECFGMNYHRRDVQISVLRAKLSYLERQPGEMREQLFIAKQRANTAGCYQWLVKAAENELLR